MNVKAQYLQQASKRRQPASMRRMSHKPQPIPFVTATATTALGTLSPRREIQARQKVIFCEDDKLFDQPIGQHSPRINKIYNKVIPGRQFQNIAASNRLFQTKPSLNNIIPARPKQFGAANIERPKSSHQDKLQMSSELFISNTELLTDQNRPGSSKSSRLFKRKGIMNHDSINSENQEFQGPIRVTSIGSNRKKSIGTSMSVRNRAGTCLTQTQRTINKIPPKIDQQFFRLFAQ